MPMANILYQLPGLNLYTGAHGLLTTSDPKHIIKHFATLIRSKNGIQIGGTTLLRLDTQRALQFSPMTSKQADDLLDPADKQNVPKAVNLVSSLAGIGKKEFIQLPSTSARNKRAVFLARVLSYFVDAFTKVEMSLSEQIRSLSTYAHLITALYQRHRTGFLTSALLADSQAVVKNVLFTLARIQNIDQDATYYILFEGTDRLEGVFSHARTQDHACNFDTLQLAQKLSIGAEINAIFQHHPDLDRGHVRRNLVNVRGVDHINPKSWLGNVRVGDVDIRREYLAGRDQANELLEKELCWMPTDFDKLFSDPNVDHLQPEGVYIGTRPSDIEESQDRDDLDDDGLLLGGLFDYAAAQLAVEMRSDISKESEEREDSDTDSDSGDNANHDTLDAELQVDVIPTIDYSPRPVDIQVDPREDVDTAAQTEKVVGESDVLHPSPSKVIESHYLAIDGQKRYKPDLVASILGGPDGKQVLSRPMRAAGLAIEASLRKRKNLNVVEDQSSEEDKIKSRNLGAILARTDGTISLAVVEILGFTQGTSKALLHAIDFGDLGAGGHKATTITIQILDLLPPNDGGTDLGTESVSWTWGGNYVQIQKNHRKETAIMQRYFTAQISGKLLHPLSPDIIWDDNDKPVWSICHKHLQETLDEAWDLLDPDTAEILTHTKTLPKVSGPGLPYKRGEQISLSRPNPTPLPTSISTNKLTGKSPMTCKLCGTTVPLSSMRTHVGKHILWAHHERPDTINDGVEISANPCGWCGGGECKTQLVQQGTKLTTASSCPYLNQLPMQKSLQSHRAQLPHWNITLR